MTVSNGVLILKDAVDKGGNAWVPPVSAQARSLIYRNQFYVVSYLHSRGDLACKINQNQALSRVFVFSEHSWGLRWLQKESTYCTVLFPFLLLGFRLLQGNTELALVFAILTFPLFSYSLSQTLLHLQTLETLYCSFSSVRGLSELTPSTSKPQLSSLPDDKAIPPLKPSESSSVFPDTLRFWTYYEQFQIGVSAFGICYMPGSCMESISQMMKNAMEKVSEVTQVSYSRRVTAFNHPISR